MTMGTSWGPRIPIVNKQFKCMVISHGCMWVMLMLGYTIKNLDKDHIHQYWHYEDHGYQHDQLGPAPAKTPVRYIVGYCGLMLFVI